MTEKCDFLPTKFLYNRYRKEMNMWYRKKLSNTLYKAVIPWEHYIYVEANYNSDNLDMSKTYYHLTTNEPMYKLHCNTNEAWNIIKTNYIKTAEGDLSAETRFIVDNFTDVDFPSDVNPRIWFIDIETSRTIDNSFPSFKNNSAEITAITIYDSYTKVYYNLGLLSDKWNKSMSDAENEIKEVTKNYGTVITYSFKDTKELLNKFMHLITKYTPDILTAWNLGFDIPYIVRKIYDHYGEEGLKQISPFNRISSKVSEAIQNNVDLNLITLIPGIDCLDLLDLYKKYENGQKESYKLNDIANLELGESKIGYNDDGEGKDLFDTYENEYVDFMKYNIQDVRLIVLIEEKCRLLKLACAIRNYTKVDYSSTIGTVAPIDSLFLMEAVRRRMNGDNRVLPSKGKNAKQKFTGAYVKPPIVGRHRWLADEDFRSLYPSITKTFKISGESLVGKVLDNQVLTLINIARFYKDDNRDIEYVMNELFPIYLYPDHSVNQYIGTEAYGQSLSELGNNYKVKIKQYEILYKDKNYPMEFDGIDEFNNWLKDNNFCLLPNGAIIDQSKEDAIISKVIADVMNKRDEYKNIMKQCLKESNKAKEEGNNELAEVKKEESIVYDMNQRAVKCINNAVYGATSSESFRLFNLDVAEGITCSGQVIIRNSRYIANKKLNELCNTKDEDYIVTIDTDSLIFTMDKLVKYDVSERRVEILEEIAKIPTIIQSTVNEEIVKVVRDIFHKNNVNKDNNFLYIKNE